jgi:putative FmdB family regulatory protein
VFLIKEDKLMPIFEYRCKKCGQVTEVLEKASAENRHKCANCGSKEMEKLFSAFGVSKNQSSSNGSCPTGTCPLT